MHCKSTYPLVGRYWSKVVKTETCWLWTGTKNKAGYGRFYSSTEGRTNYLAHDFAFWLEHGRWPEIRGGHGLSHTCHNRACVNPAHLIEESQSENMLRSSRDGRSVGAAARASHRERKSLP